MITRLQIKNFRSFDQFEIEGFSRFNLLVGGNGLGKTTVMEAIACVANGDNIKFYQKLLTLRSLYEPSIKNDIPFRSFFHKMDFDSDAQITCYAHDASSEQVILKGNKIAWELSDLPEENNVTTRSDSLERFSVYHKSSRVKTWTSQAWEAELNLAPVGVSHHSMGAIWVQPGDFDMRELAFTIGHALKDEAKKRFFLSSVQVLQPDVIDCMYVPGDLVSGYIYLKFKDGASMPLQLLGSGAMWMIYILSRCIYGRHKIICIDEIDSGLHRSVMKDFWKGLMFCMQHDSELQIFATTHSEEFLEVATEVFAEEQEMIRLFRFYRNLKTNKVEYKSNPWEILESIHEMKESFT